MRLVIAALLALTLGTVAAQAYTCNTSCNTVGGYTTCYQNCF